VGRQFRGLGVSRTDLELLSCIVSREDGILVLAWVAVQLPAVDFDGLQVEAAVGELLVAAVLPLHYAFRASG
jgi:hypothetical protein